MWHRTCLPRSFKPGLGQPPPPRHTPRRACEREVPMKIGIIGGAGPLASALLYQKLLEACYIKEAKSMPEIVLLNYPFTRCLSQSEEQAHYAITRSELQYCIDQLAAYGVEQAVIACNTLHLFL